MGIDNHEDSHMSDTKHDDDSKDIQEEEINVLNEKDDQQNFLNFINQSDIQTSNDRNAFFQMSIKS